MRYGSLNRVYNLWYYYNYRSYSADYFTIDLAKTDAAVTGSSLKTTEQITIAAVKKQA